MGCLCILILTYWIFKSRYFLNPQWLHMVKLWDWGGVHKKRKKKKAHLRTQKAIKKKKTWKYLVLKTALIFVPA